MLPSTGDRDRAGTFRVCWSPLPSLCLGRLGSGASLGTREGPKMGLIQGLPKSLKGSSEWEVCWKKFASCRGSPRTRTHRVGSGDLAGARQ